MKKIMIPEYLEMIVMKSQLGIMQMKGERVTGCYTDIIYLWCG